MPTPPSPPMRSVDIVMPAGRAGATVYLDDLTPTPGGHTATLDASGQCLFGLVSARAALPQSYIRVTAAGFLPYEQHLEMPAGDNDGNFQIRIGVPLDPTRPQDLLLPDLTPTVTAPEVILATPPPPALPDRPPVATAMTAHTRAQLTDIQTNLMLYIGDLPALVPQFVDQPNGQPAYDARFHMRNRGDNGATPHGIVGGQWMWTVALPLYPEALWPLLFKQAKEKFSCTHWALHVAQPPVEWYHGVFSTAGVDWGAATTRAHGALLAAGLIPICAGVSTNQPLAAGFDGKSALVAMTDWDDFDTADCQINAIAAAFPNALLYYERPGPSPRLSPKPDACSTVQPHDDNGGAWLRSVQQRCPNFMGVLYEVNIWEGLQRCIDELTRCHAFWRDVQEVRFETNTYQLFWQGGDPHAFIAVEDQLQAGCPWLRGYGSGGTAHPAPADQPAIGGDLPPGDAFAFHQAVQHRGPAFTNWPATTAITRLEFRSGGVHIEFSKKDGAGRWPDITPPGWRGPLQYCLGMAMQIAGVWHVSAPIQFWNGLDESGGNVGDAAPRDNGIVGTIHGDWFYSSAWGPLQRQPATGELVGFFVVAGNVRGVDDAVSVQERSNVVVVPFPDAHGAIFATNP